MESRRERILYLFKIPAKQEEKEEKAKEETIITILLLRAPGNQASKVRSQEFPRTVVNYQKNSQSRVRFQENPKSLSSSEDGSQRNQSKERSSRTRKPAET